MKQSGSGPTLNSSPGAPSALADEEDEGPDGSDFPGSFSATYSNRPSHAAQARHAKVASYTHTHTHSKEVHAAQARFTNKSCVSSVWASAVGVLYVGISCGCTVCMCALNEC